MGRTPTRTPIARPFVKWAGGKQNLLSTFDALFPPGLRNRRITRYVEPFVGGGAVFFYVRFKYAVPEAVLCDANPALINCWRCVQQDPGDFFARFDALQRRYLAANPTGRAAMYYEQRAAFNERLQREWNGAGDMDAAVRFLFLNRTAYNGLYRLNRSGMFNVPHGRSRYPHTPLLLEDHVMTVSSLLQGVTLLTGDYTACLPHITDDAFVYFDPPYRPVSTTAKFTQYAGDFDDAQQRHLARFFRRLDGETGARLMLSNAGTPDAVVYFSPLFEGFDMRVVYCNRPVNRNGDGRGRVPELVVRNYTDTAD